MKNKIILTIIFLVMILIPIVVHLSSTFNAKAEAQTSNKDKKVSQKLIEELHKEQQLLEQEKQRLQQLERNLRNFEIDLDKRFDDYLMKKKQLEDQQAEFQEKVEAKMVDRQTIETYENIDPEQAATLLKNLYLSDSALATLIMRKIAGKKAGKILEAMIPVDKEISTKLAEDTLNYFKPKEDQ